MRHHSHHGRRFARDDDGPHRQGERFQREFGGGPGRGPMGSGPGRGPMGRGPGRGRGGLGRFFAHGDLRLVILSLIAEKPRHGYEIIKEIEDRVGGAYSPSPGVIYPTLTLLEELGHVTVTTGEGAKKLHTITEAGTQYLAANRATLDPIMARMDEARQAEPSTAPPVQRAIENLRMALRLRLERKPLCEPQVHAIAAALDAAATAIEQS